MNNKWKYRLTTKLLLAIILFQNTPFHPFKMKLKNSPSDFDTKYNGLIDVHCTMNQVHHLTCPTFNLYGEPFLRHHFTAKTFHLKLKFEIIKLMKTVQYQFAAMFLFYLTYFQYVKYWYIWEWIMSANGDEKLLKSTWE